MDQKTRLAAFLAIVLMFSALWYVTRPRGSTERSLLGEVVEKATGSIEAWAGTQLETIANDLLNPTLAFERFEFELPVTCTFHGVRLEAEGQAILVAEAIRVELREAPEVGSPIVIESITMTTPVVHIVSRDDGTIIGYDDLLKSTAGEVHEDGGSSRPSDILAIRNIRIHDGALHLQQSSGRSMTLDGLNLDLANQPEEDPGWYAIAGEIGRQETLTIDVDARFNLDTGVVDLAPTSLHATIVRDAYDAFPPDLQEALAALSLGGDLNADVEGTVSLTDLPAASLRWSATLADAHVWVDRYQLPIDHLEVDGTLSDGLVRLDRFASRMLGGTVEGNAKMRLDGTRLAVAEWAANGLRLEDVLRGDESRLSGIVQSSGGASMELQSGIDTVAGQGSVRITDGQLLDQVVFGELMSVFGASADDEGTDHGMATIALAPSGVTLSEIELISRRTAARGEGTVSWAGDLDLRFNGGPMERLQAELGAIGDLLGGLTDAILKYHVTGTTQDPIFNVRPLGLGG